MTRIHIRIVLVFVVFAIATLAFAGTASAGWTWTDTDGWTWTDDAALTTAGGN